MKLNYPTKKYLRLLRRRIKQGLISLGVLKNPYVPTPLFSDDVFLVSYPRSGNTWLRFILAYLRNPDAEINFKNISDFIPAGAGSADSVWRTGQKMRPRVIKHHAQFQKEFPKVIYLVRDGRDVYSSYYFFLKKKLQQTTSLVDFIKYTDSPYGSWSKHVNSWLDARLGEERFMLIKYEELLKAPITVLEKIIGFCGVQYSTDEIIRAINKASFEKMSTIEKKSGFPDINDFSGVFVRKGKTGNWKGTFGESEIKVFKHHHNNALLRLNYEEDSEWV